MILVTIVGNAFVIAAVLLEKNLHNVANYLILSLAVADLMVATLVMPIGIVDAVTTKWMLQSEVCDMWISFDVLCCTASILHLLAIAIDRYWAVTNIDYIRNRSAKRILLMIAIAWAAGLCLSVLPLFGWRKPEDSAEIRQACVISQDISYQIFATSCAFYIPTIIMLIIYAKIYQVARSRIRRKNFMKKNSKRQTNGETISTPTLNTAALTNGHTEVIADAETSFITNGCNDRNDNSKFSKNGDIDEVKVSILPKVNFDASKAKRQKEKLEMKRERKAARTLGIITGTFIVCWLPFFVNALVEPINEVQIPEALRMVVNWLGYLNSLLNPIIYTIFSPDFRNAFRKILFGKYKRHR
ncbi:hypothetical protein FSP39_001281 [Pinctada imbricata]|uniref:G-protein coupled receptors family 1 profile domain-containing protein n=1 Tax=Pinctada imbricata TaxID=66713 RepID=A0AA88YUN5_PINIB|nr:hypothetical protein FSP39_001281 [Pinctada imbricata]